jgi:hypothetical protein
MGLAGFWHVAQGVYRRVGAFLEQLYSLGPAAHGAQGVLREFLDGPPDGVQLTWTGDRDGPICEARDGRGCYRVEFHRVDGHWAALSCSCLGFLEFRRECRHLRAAREALVTWETDEAGEWK